MKNLPLIICILSFINLTAQDLYFPDNDDNDWAVTSASDLGWCEDKIPELLTFLEESDTKAFLILKNGKIVIEEYMNGHTQDSFWYWASAGKSLNAFEIGMLQEEGALDINNTTSDYLDSNWTSCKIFEESKIKVKHQLTMTSGLDYTVEEIDCTLPECLHCLNETEWYYHNAPYTLLSDVIENVSGRNHTLHTFLTLGSAISLTGAWVPVGDNKVFFSKPRSMARFRLLMNGRGTWDNEIILGDEDYFDQMINPSQTINESYGHLWWLNTGPTYRLPGSTITFNGKLIPSAPNNLYMALGKNSQVLMVDPKEDIVIVRMGEDPDESLVPITYINNLWDHIQSIVCTSTATTHTNERSILLSPNPASEFLNINTDFNIDRILINSIDGKTVQTLSNIKKINISNLEKGVYIINIYSEDIVQTEKFIKY